MKKVVLSELIDALESGSRPKGGVSGDSGTVPSLGAEHLDGEGGISFDNPKYISSDFFQSMKRGRIQKGDVLIVKDGATTGKVSFIDEQFSFKQAAINEHVFRLAVNSHKALPKYIYYYLSGSKGTAQVMLDFRGATVGGISQSFLDKVTVPLFEISEQRRTVEILDKINDIRVKRKISLQLLNKFLNAVFFKMFGEPLKNDKGWKVCKLGDLADKITDGTHKTPDYQTYGIVFISARNITNGRIVWKNVKYISPKEHSEINARCNPERGDLLLTKSGSIGAAALVDVDSCFSLFESLALIKYKRDCLDGYFLKDFLNLDITKRMYASAIKGISIRHLHLIEIKNLNIICPPLKLQQEYAEIAKQVDRTRLILMESAEIIENQFNALMQKYFG